MSLLGFAVQAAQTADVLGVLNNPVVQGVGVTAIGAGTLWLGRVILATRDTVREIRGLLMNRRNGLVKQVDDHEVRIDAVENHLGIRART